MTVVYVRVFPIFAAKQFGLKNRSVFVQYDIQPTIKNYTMAKIQKMITRNYCGVSFAAILDKRFSLADGRYNVSVRITHKYRRYYVLSGTTMTENEYDRSVSAKHGEWYSRRVDVERVFDRVYDIGRQMIDYGSFAFGAIKDRMNGGGGMMLSEVYEMRIGELRKENRIGTMSTYVSSLRKWLDVIGDVKMMELDATLIGRFVDRCSEDNSNSTIGIYLRCLRAIVNYAIYLDIIPQSRYPFSKSKYDRLVKIPATAKRDDRFLSIDDILNVDALDKTDTERWCWSMWMFSYLCGGMNLADIGCLRSENIVGNTITFSRKKTRKTTTNQAKITIPITDRINAIMKEYANSEGLLFPLITRSERDEQKVKSAVKDCSKKIGKYVTRLCERAGVKGATMTHARHSFKTNMMRKGVPERYTEMAMGHSMQDVGSFYVGGFTIEQMVEFHNRLLEK